MVIETDVKVAVVDLGTARTKVTVAWRSADGLRTETKSLEVSLSESAVAEAPGGADGVIAGLAASVSEVLKAANVRRVVYLGAQAFRSGSMAVPLYSAARKAMPNFSVLSTEQEAGIFYIDVGAGRVGPDYYAVDVGGGSVQLVWGAQPGCSISRPVGTFALEKEFQADKSIAILPGSEAWCRMRARVLKEFSEDWRKGTPAGDVFIGSNVMASFFGNAAREAGFRVAPGTLDKSSIERLALLIGGKPYSESYYLFPENNGFIHGADKLLAVVSAMMELLECETVIGTNASSSKGMCKLLLEEPSALLAFSIVANEIGA